MPHLHIVAPAGTPPRILAALDALSDALVGGARAYDLSREEAICIQALLLGASAEELIASRDRGASIAPAILAGATIALTSAHASAAARADADKASAATPQDEPEIAALKRRALR